jgi:hypothetical protein
MTDARSQAQQLAAKHLAAGDSTGWFEVLYAAAAGRSDAIPWADLKPNPNLLSWLDSKTLPTRGNALTIGCGLGDDAEELSRRGLNVTAFDISATAIDWCRRRFPNSTVQYTVADLLKLPPQWNRAFDFVFESYTLQALPPELHKQAIANVAQSVAANGTLLVICKGRDPHDPPGSVPWPLLKTELNLFTGRHGFTEISFEDYLDSEDPPVRRFRGVYRDGK